MSHLSKFGPEAKRLGVIAALVCVMGVWTAALAQDVPSGSPLTPPPTTTEEPKRAEPAKPGDVTPVPSTTFEPTALGPRSVEGGPNIEQRAREQDNLLGRNLLLREPPKPGEFEKYVRTVADRPIPRYGQDLLLPASRDFAVPATAQHVLNLLIFLHTTLKED